MPDFGIGELLAGEALFGGAEAAGAIGGAEATFAGSAAAEAAGAVGAAETFAGSETFSAPLSGTETFEGGLPGDTIDAGRFDTGFPDVSTTGLTGDPSELYQNVAYEATTESYPTENLDVIEQPSPEGVPDTTTTQPQPEGAPETRPDGDVERYPADYRSGPAAAKAGKLVRDPSGQFNPGNLLSSLLRGAMGPSRPPQLQQATGVATNIQNVGQQLIDQYNRGELSGPVMANLRSSLNSAVSQIRQHFKSAGTFNSTARIQAERNAYLQASASMAQALQQQLTQGLQALGQAGQLLLASSGQVIQSDTAFANSLMQSLGGVLRLPVGGGSRPANQVASQTPQVPEQDVMSGGGGGEFEQEGALA